MDTVGMSGFPHTMLSGVTTPDYEKAAMQTVTRRKLIEVSLPLEEINRESAREKSIRHGHPSTLHLWWARRPLAAARAVLFAQLVDDPSSDPNLSVEQQKAERERLHNLIRRLVKWENVNNEALLREAHEEILKSTDGSPPAILDPFAGGGTIPLEAQRLGLVAHSSDLNPVAVLINKALIEIPPKFGGQPPVFPGAASTTLGPWSRAGGLAEDVRLYGLWMRDQARQRIGNLYPNATVLESRTGKKSTVATIAWIWARTVTCPNPACGIEMPLVRSWWLGKKKGKEAYVVARVVDDSSAPTGRRVEFTVGHDKSRAPTTATDGTVGRQGAVCVACQSAVELKYIRTEGRAHRMSQRLMAIVAPGNGRRVYLAPTREHIEAAEIEAPRSVPSGKLAQNPRDFKTPNYGMVTFAELFTKRQLLALTTFSDLVGEMRGKVLTDALAAGVPLGDRLADGGAGAAAYADAVTTYLVFALSKFSARNNTMCTWESGMDRLRGSFQRQAIPMTWDFAEANPIEDFGGGFGTVVDSESEVLDHLPNPALPR